MPLPLKKNDTVTLEITDLAFGGAGIGRVDGKVIFVNGVMPGEIAEVRITRNKKDFAEAMVEKLITTAPERITPRCPHAWTIGRQRTASCGGCTWQYADYATQLQWKEKCVRDAFTRIAGSTALPLHPILPCATPWYYRNKMEFSWYDKDGVLQLGLHPPGYFRDVVDLQECFLQSPTVITILHVIRTFAQTKKLTLFRNPPGSGLLRTVTLREGKNTGELMINFVTSGDAFPFAAELVQLCREAVPSLTSLYHTVIHVQKGTRTRIEERLLYGKPFITDVIVLKNDTKLSFTIHPQAFFQPNTLQAGVLYSTVLDFLTRDQNHHGLIYDLYCGTGTIGMFCATCADTVIGVEVGTSAIENARHNATANNLKNIDFFVGDATKLLLDDKGPLHAKPDAVIVDPPRAGLTGSLIDKIAEKRPPLVLYVSCNPSTLARDSERFLNHGYRITDIQPVDMFPQTFHVETVVRYVAEPGT